jgi:fatty acid desaturase
MAKRDKRKEYGRLAFSLILFFTVSAPLFPFYGLLGGSFLTAVLFVVVVYIFCGPTVSNLEWYNDNQYELIEELNHEIQELQAKLEREEAIHNCLYEGQCATCGAIHHD